MRDIPLTYEHADGFVRRGRVVAVTNDTVRLDVPALTPGDVAVIERRDESPLLTEVRAADGMGARCIPLGSVAGVLVSAPASSKLARLGAFVGSALLGQTLDGWGRGTIARRMTIAPLDAASVPLADRAPIDTAMRTGVAAVDAFATLGYGQRVSLTAGAGVGKTTLVRRIVEQADVDARVVALIGERGREAAETRDRLRSLPCWPQTSLYSVTSDAAPIERFTAARAATAQAEWLCATGRRVLLVIDSLTRVAAAWREMALAAGEPPAHRGYPPSLSTALARLVERAGARKVGSVTAVYTVLVDADDEFEPVTDALRALLDGHIALARRHANAARYPAIDVLRSLSRAMPEIIAPAHRSDAALVRRAIAALEDAEDLFAIGVYRHGGDQWLDTCVAVRPAIETLVFDGHGSCTDPLEQLASIARQLRCTPGPQPAIA